MNPIYVMIEYLNKKKLMSSFAIVDRMQNLVDLTSSLGSGGFWCMGQSRLFYASGCFKRYTLTAVFAIRQCAEIW
ncbi:hypothetical protein [Sphingobacterium deserti]|uniref:Uncharacterized protein n=1 Tax=Sphingobacterium deserti TaxID=1229276 RepID=A0A0B8T5P1_9SPHI|nr:hypothetical protein [Sphingobacterium deserti]KGE15993.1 hypothetical protein DI53_0108 [Sphingobacterium deserti]